MKNENKKHLIRRENLVSLIDHKFNGNKAEFSRSVGISPVQIYRVFSEGKSRRNLGEDTVRRIEQSLRLSDFWMDKKHQVIQEEPAKYNLLSKKDSLKTVEVFFFYWSYICYPLNSNIYKKELRPMILRNINNTSNNLYGIEIDTDIFPEFPEGTEVLVDPDKTAENGNTVIISFEDKEKTLARYLTTLGELHIEPLERGMPGTKNIEGKKFTIHGVIILKGFWKKV